VTLKLKPFACLRKYDDQTPPVRQSAYNSAQEKQINSMANKAMAIVKTVDADTLERYTTHLPDEWRNPLFFGDKENG